MKINAKRLEKNGEKKCEKIKKRKSKTNNRKICIKGGGKKYEKIAKTCKKYKKRKKKSKFQVSKNLKEVHPPRE